MSNCAYLCTIKSMVNLGGKTLYNSAIDQVNAGCNNSLIISLGTLFLHIEELFSYLGTEKCNDKYKELKDHIQGRLDLSCDDIRFSESFQNILTFVTYYKDFPDERMTFIFYEIIYRSYFGCPWKSLSCEDKKLFQQLCTNFLRGSYLGSM